MALANALPADTHASSVDIHCKPSLPGVPPVGFCGPSTPFTGSSTPFFSGFSAPQFIFNNCNVNMYNASVTRVFDYSLTKEQLDNFSNFD